MPDRYPIHIRNPRTLLDDLRKNGWTETVVRYTTESRIPVESHLFLPSSSTQRKTSEGNACCVVIPEGHPDKAYLKLMALGDGISPPVFFDTAALSSCVIAKESLLRTPLDILPGQGQGIPAQTPATGMPCTPRVVLQGLAGMRVMPTLSYRQAVFPAISSSSILSPSLRIFIAAFRSRSIVKPHLSHT